MRPPLRRVRAARAALLLAGLAALVAGCGSGGGHTGGGQACTRSSQCGAGEGCLQGTCQPLPCGGCQADEVCQESGSCAAAQGVRCPTSPATCPDGYLCNSAGVCSVPCVLNGDCGDPRLVCNPATASCAQCIFDRQCAGVAGRHRCDSASGACVACLQPIDCPPGSSCDAATHSCAAGCRQDADCNLSAGEFCSGASAAAQGRCIQCNADASATPGAGVHRCDIGAPACDPTGRCAICTADRYCRPGTPRCDALGGSCVECLPDSNSSGADCGYQFSAGGARDPHDARSCDPLGHRCVDGCATDAQCGCPIDPATQKPTRCSRRYLQERCDPALTSMPAAGGGALAPTLGGCVECSANLHCRCKVSGAQTDPACAGWPGVGSLDGARCTKDASG